MMGIFGMIAVFTIWKKNSLEKLFHKFQESGNLYVSRF